MAKFLFTYKIRGLYESYLVVCARNRAEAVKLFFVDVAGCFAEQDGNLHLVSVLNLSNVKAIGDVVAVAVTVD